MRVRFGPLCHKMGFGPMLDVRHLCAGFDTLLFEDVSFCLNPSEFLGLYGPSGVGKSTLGRVLAGLHKPVSGAVHVDGNAQVSLGFQPVQYLHQNPVLTMNPRWRVERVIREAAAPSDDLLEAMGFSMEWLTRFPHELSGGQLQRVSIIRALSGKPKYLIADEITASLDPISQAKIWQSLKAIAEQEHIGVLVISHDQALIDRICTSTITLR